MAAISDTKSFIDFLEKRIDRMSRYHNHKESMVNAGFIVQITLFGSIVMEDVWPPKWLPGDSIFSSLSTLMVYFIFWLLIHLFMTWQMQNKLISSLYYNAYERSVRQLVMGGLSKEDLAVEDDKNEEVKISTYEKIFGRIFPTKGIAIKYDINPAGFPNFVKENLRKSFEKGTAAKWHEHLMIYGSLLMVIAAVVRILYMGNI